MASKEKKHLNYSRPHVIDTFFTPVHCTVGKTAGADVQLRDVLVAHAHIVCGEKKRF